MCICMYKLASIVKMIRTCILDSLHHSDHKTDVSTSTSSSSSEKDETGVPPSCFRLLFGSRVSDFFRLPAPSFLWCSGNQKPKEMRIEQLRWAWQTIKIQMSFILLLLLIALRVMAKKSSQLYRFRSCFSSSVSSKLGSLPHMKAAL